MVLVLIFLGVFIILLSFICMLISSTIKINVKQLELENILLPKVTYDYNIEIGFYLLGKIPFLKFKINKARLKKLKIMEKMKKAQVVQKIEWNGDLLKELKTLSPKIEELNLVLNIGTEDALYTSAIVFIISTILSLGLPHFVESKNYKKIKYEITPFFTGKNLFSLQVHSIIYVKMVHIINIIYIYLQKRREEKYERTSNRRPYADSYEQYSRYGRCKYHYRGTN